MAIMKSNNNNNRSEPFFIKRSLQSTCYTWIIEDFRRRKEKQGIALTSPTFGNDQGIQFEGLIYPNGTEDASFVAFYLSACTDCPIWVKARFSLKVLDKNGDFKFRKICKDPLLGPGHKVGWSKFCPRRKILDALNQILRNGQLTLVIEVYFIGENISNDHMDALLSLSPLFEPKSKSGTDEFKGLWEAKRFDHSLKSGEKLIPVHRVVLASSSPQLDRALIRDRRTFLAIDDSYDSSTIKDIVYFLYHATFEFKPRISQLKQMLRFSHQYDVEMLKFRVEQLLYESCEKECILDIFMTTQKYNSTNLLQAVKFLLIENIESVTKTRGWCELLSSEPSLVTSLVQFLGQELRKVRGV